MLSRCFMLKPADKSLDLLTVNCTQRWDMCFGNLTI